MFYGFPATSAILSDHVAVVEEIEVVALRAQQSRKREHGEYRCQKDKCATFHFEDILVSLVCEYDIYSDR